MFLDKKQSRYLYWLLVGIGSFLLIFLLVKLFPFYKALFSFVWHLFVPFLLAAFLAYLLYPIIVRMQHYGIPNWLAILLIYGLFFGGGAYLGYRLYPMVVIELRDLREHLPQLLEVYENAIYQMYESTSFLPETVHDKMDQMIQNVESRLEERTGYFIGNVMKIFDMIVFLTVLPVLVFYFLKDYEMIRQFVLDYIPQKRRSMVKFIIQGIDESLGHYIRGQFLVCLFVSLATYLAFEWLNMDYSLLLAIIMGLTNIIPYFGPIIGAVPAVAIAVTISGKTVLFVILAAFLIQVIESNLISPYIVGKSIAIHPIVIIFALLLGGGLAGVLGMILAVPLLTILREIIRRFMAVRQM